MESDSGLTYLAVAYSVFFLLLAYYVGRLLRRNGELQDAVRELESRFEKSGNGA